MNSERKLLDILTRLTEAGCERVSEIDGDISCFYCDAWIDIGDTHEDDCPYAEAKEIVDAIDGGKGVVIEFPSS